MALESSLREFLNLLPNEVASKIDFLIILIQALGGLFIIYLIFTILRFFAIRKQNKIIKEIRSDVKFIKNKLKNKKKKK